MQPSIRLDLVSLKDTSLCTIRAYSDLVIAQLQTVVISDGFEQSMSQLLMSTCPIDVIMCAAANPLQFQKDQADILKQRVQRDTKQFLKAQEAYELQSIINSDNFKLLDEVFEMNTETEIHDQMKMLKEVYLEVLIQQELKDEQGNSQGFREFLKQINDAHEIQRVIKSKQQNQDNLCCKKLQYLKNQDRQENKISNSYFNKTIQYRISENIKKFYNQTQIEDNILSKSQQQQIGNKTKRLIIKNNQKVSDIPLDTDSIWSIIEKQLLIERMRQSNEKDVKSQMNLFNPKVSTSEEIKYQLEFFTRIAIDKLFEKTTSKIARKSNLQLYENVPYFSSLVKDFKRLSLVFIKSEHIVMFVDQLKMIFGNNQEKEIKSENQDVVIRIREIKNKFEAYLTLEPSDQRDLKVIFDVYYPKKQLSLFLECQCNVLSLIRWKVADHIFQDFISAEENYKSMTKHINQNDILEKLFRNVLRMLYCIIICIALQITFKVSFKFQDYKQKKNIEMNCQDGSKFCFQYCMQYGYADQNTHILKDHCQFQIEKQGIQNHSRNELLFFCNKYNKTNAAIPCQNIFKPGLIGGTANEHICYYNKPDQVECIDNFMSEKLKSIGKFQKIIMNNDKLAIINNQHELSGYQETTTPKFNTIQSFIDKNGSRKIRDLKLSESRVCTLSDDNNLQCSRSVYHYNINTISIGKRHSCYINLGKLLCWGTQLQGKIKVPFELQSNVHSVSAGIHFTCASKQDGKLHCFGQNFYGELDYDRNQMERGIIKKFSSKYSFACLINDQDILQCWGSKAPLLPQSQKAISVSVGNDHLCIIEPRDKLMCHGDNKFGKSEVPIELILDIKQTSLGQNHSCAINKQDRLACWGTTLDGNVPVPKEFNDKVMQVKTRLHTCVIQKQDKLGCWGPEYQVVKVDMSQKNRITNFNNSSSIPDEQVSKKTLIFAVGHGHTTAVNEKGVINCWGESKHQNYGVCDIPQELQINKENSLIDEQKVMVPKLQNNDSQSTEGYDGGLIIKSGFTVNKVQSFVMSSDDNVCWNHSVRSDEIKLEVGVESGSGKQDRNQHVDERECYLEYEDEDDDEVQGWQNSDQIKQTKGEVNLMAIGSDDDFSTSNSSNSGSKKRPPPIEVKSQVARDNSNDSVEYDTDSSISNYRRHRRQSNACQSPKINIDTVQCNIDSKNVSTSFQPQNNMMCLTITDLCQVPLKNNKMLKCKNRKTMFKQIQKENTNEIISISCGYDRVCILRQDNNLNKFIECQGGLNIYNQNEIHRKMVKKDTQSIVASKQSTCIMKTNKKLQCNGKMAKTTPDKINWDLKIIEQDKNQVK